MFKKLDSAAVKEIKHIAIGEVTGVFLMCFVFFLLGKFSAAVLYSGIIGGTVAMTGFIWLCFSVQATVDKAARGEDTKGSMTKSYIGRMILYAGWVVCAVKFACFSSIAGALPVLFPSFTIKIMNLFNSFKKDKEEK